MNNSNSSGFTRGPIILTCLTVAILILSHYSEPSYGATYYVSPDGSDSNLGTEVQPWLTIQKAADTLVAGDTVYIKAGTYNESVITQNSGNAGNYITYAAYTDDTVIIDGAGVTDRENGVIMNQSYIKLTDLEITHWNGNALWAENAGYLEISDCVVHDVAYGIGVADGTHDFVFNRVEAYHFDYYGFDASPSGGADCYNGTFNDCIAHTWRDPALGHECDGFALSHQGNQHDFVLNRCKAHTVGDGFVIGGNNVTVNRCSAHDAEVGYKIWGDDVTIVNCLSYHNETSNLELDWDEKPGTTTVQNCTFMDAQIYNIWVENAGDSLHMYNSILVAGDTIGLAFEQMGVNNYQGNYNIFHNDDASRAIVVGYEDEFSLSQIETGAWTTYSGQDANSLTANSTTELFVNPTAFDLHLLSTSPALDKGTSSGAPSEDYDGVPRPQGEGYDIGAYEYSTGIITTSTTTSSPSMTTTTISGVCPSESFYGKHSEKTKLLRYIRDDILSQTHEGQEIIQLYYRWSPMIVRAMEADKEFKQDVKEMIDGVLPLISGTVE